MAKDCVGTLDEGFSEQIETWVNMYHCMPEGHLGDVNVMMRLCALK